MSKQIWKTIIFLLSFVVLTFALIRFDTLLCGCRLPITSNHCISLIFLYLVRFISSFFFAVAWNCLIVFKPLPSLLRRVHTVHTHKRKKERENVIKKYRNRNMSFVFVVQIHFLIFYNRKTMQNSWTSDVKKIDEPTETIKHAEDVNEEDTKKSGIIKTPWR